MPSPRLLLDCRGCRREMNLRFMPIPRLLSTLIDPLRVGAISHEEY
jgi:hypothetical protein